MKYIGKRRHGSLRKMQFVKVMAGFKYAPESPATYIPGKG